MADRFVDLTRLLPTGTMLAFQLISPIASDNGHCQNAVGYKYASGAFLVICGLVCVIASFTDSYISNVDRQRHYGFITTTGLRVWSPPATVDVASQDFKIRFGDLVHAFGSLTVFAALGLLDRNIVDCFYPGFNSSHKSLMEAIPLIVGVLVSAIFMFFPSNRHGIGFPMLMGMGSMEMGPVPAGGADHN